MRSSLRFALASLLVLCSTTASALQLPVPLSSGSKFRLAVDPTLTTDFAGVNRTELSVDFTHSISKEFQWGLSAHGGAVGQSIFGNLPVSPTIGADLMGRYFGAITDVFHLGLQIDVLYAHKFSNEPILNSLGFRLSVPFAMSFDKVVAFFVSPGIQFEGQVYQTRYLSPSLMGQGLGMNILGGFVIYTGGPGVFVAARPTWGDVRRMSEVSADFGLGLVFDL